MNSYENPELSYECDLTAERDRLKALLLECCNMLVFVEQLGVPISSWDLCKRCRAALSRATETKG